MEVQVIPLSVEYIKSTPSVLRSTCSQGEVRVLENFKSKHIVPAHAILKDIVVMVLGAAVVDPIHKWVVPSGDGPQGLLNCAEAEADQPVPTVPALKLLFINIAPPAPEEVSCTDCPHTIVVLEALAVKEQFVCPFTIS